MDRDAQRQLAAAAVKEVPWLESAGAANWYRFERSYTAYRARMGEENEALKSMVQLISDDVLFIVGLESGKPTEALRGMTDAQIRKTFNKLHAPADEVLALQQLKKLKMTTTEIDLQKDYDFVIVFTSRHKVLEKGVNLPTDKLVTRAFEDGLAPEVLQGRVKSAKPDTWQNAAALAIASAKKLHVAQQTLGIPRKTSKTESGEKKSL